MGKYVRSFLHLLVAQRLYRAYRTLERSISLCGVPRSLAIMFHRGYLFPVFIPPLWDDIEKLEKSKRAPKRFSSRLLSSTICNISRTLASRRSIVFTSNEKKKGYGGVENLVGNANAGFGLGSSENICKRRTWREREREKG